MTRCSDALRRGGVDGAGEDIAAENDNGTRGEGSEAGALENGLAAFAQEEGIERET
jgi:hypothetical protein